MHKYQYQAKKSVINVEFVLYLVFLLFLLSSFLLVIM